MSEEERLVVIEQIVKRLTKEREDEIKQVAGGIK